jgi:hypothetical protein
MRPTRFGILGALLTLTLVTGAALAQPHRDDDDAAAGEDPRALVDAATSNALERLRGEVGAARITRGLTVDEFVRQTDSEAELKQVLRRAQQIGGPRWTDGQELCQVQLEIAGARVADALVAVASAKPRRAPLPAEELARELRAWRDRSFSATGKSRTPVGVEMLKPYPRHAREWDGVGDDLRVRAVRAAHQDAARRALESVRGVELSTGLTVGDAMARPGVAERMNTWFERRPVKSVSFNENLQVDLALGAPPDEAFDELMSALGPQRPADEQAVARARDEFARRMAEPVGRANVARDAVQASPEPVELPPQAPEWVGRQVDAEGAAPPPAKNVKALARVNGAQDRAVQNLRAKVGALPLTDGLTVDDAARKDPIIARAVDRAMLRARVYKVDYGAAGDVTVRMSIDARDVWEEISNAR